MNWTLDDVRALTEDEYAELLDMLTEDANP